MNVIDSSGWLEYFADAENAEFFREVIEDTENVLVPTLCPYEVFKRVTQQRGEVAAFQAIALMHRGQVVELTAPLALNAAALSLETRLPMTDSVILATARSFSANLWTQDSDFEGIAGGRFRHKSP